VYWEKAFSHSPKHLNVTRGVKVWKRNAQFAKNHIPRLTRRVSIAVMHAPRKLAKQSNPEKYLFARVKYSFDNRPS